MAFADLSDSQLPFDKKLQLAAKSFSADIAEKLTDQDHTWRLNEYALWSPQVYFDFATTGLVLKQFIKSLRSSFAMFYFLGPTWNFVDSLAVLVDVPRMYRAVCAGPKSERTLSMAILIANIFWNAVGVPVLNLWAIAEVNEESRLAQRSDTPLGFSVMLAGMSFAIGMFICGIDSLVKWYRASAKSSQAGLEKYIENEIDFIDAKAQDMDAQLDDVESGELLLPEVKLNQLYDDRNAMVAKLIEGCRILLRLQMRSAPSYGGIDIAELMFLDALIAKQQREVRLQGFDCIAWMLAGIGSGIVAFGLALPPIMMWVGALFMVVAAMMKGSQAWQQTFFAGEDCYSTHRQRAELFEWHAKTRQSELEHLSSKELYYHVRWSIIRSYFYRPDIRMDSWVSDAEEARIVDLQCSMFRSVDAAPRASQAIGRYSVEQMQEAPGPNLANFGANPYLVVNQYDADNPYGDPFMFLGF